MKQFASRAEVIRVAAHFVERDEAVENIKGCIFNSLCGHRCCELLEFAGEMKLGFTILLSELSQRALQNHVADKVKHFGGGLRVAADGKLHSLVDILLIRQMDSVSGNIRSIHGKARNQRCQRIVQPREGKVAAMAVVARKAMKLL